MASAVATAVGMLAVAGGPAIIKAADPVAASDAPLSVTLTPMGSSDLAVLGHDGLVKPRGQNGDVAVLGTTAFVGGGSLFHGAQSTSGRICTDYGGVKVVDVSNPSAPAVTRVIDVDDTKSVLVGPRGNPRRGQFIKNVATSVSALDAIRHPVLDKDILGIATQRCEPSFFNGGRVEFWDVTDRANPVRLGFYDGGAVQWGIYEEVKMFTRNDGPGGATQVYALLATPFSVGNAHDATNNGDFRMLNITNPASPTVAKMFPSLSIGQNTNNGCRTFMGGRSASPTPDGSNVRFSFYDGAQPTNAFIERTGLGTGGKSAAVFDLQLDNMPQFNTGSSPRTFTPNPKTWGYAPAPSGGRTANGTIEGNAADVQAFDGPNGESLTWVSEDDYDAALTNVSITSPAGLHPDTRGCQNIIGKHLYSSPGQQVAADVAYVGRACPASPLINTSLTTADPYVESPAGKIALVEGGGDGFNGCSWGDKVKRLTADNAVAVVGNLGCCLSYFIPTGDGPIPSIPTVGVLYQVYNKMAGYVPDRVLGGVTFPNNWERSSTTNVSVKPYALSVSCSPIDTCQAATNATPIVMTTGIHGLATGDKVTISDVAGNTAANGNWTVTVLSTTTFSLNGSAGNGAWTGGGIVRPCPAGDPTCAAVPIRTDFSRFRSQANATDRAARANVNAGVVTLTANATAAPATIVGATQPTQTLSVSALPRALPASSTVRFANGEQAILSVAAAAGATSLTVIQSDSSVAGAIPSGTTGSAAFEVVPGRVYKAGATLEVETYVSGTYRAAVVWHDGAGAEIAPDSEIGNRSAVTAGRERVTANVTAPAGAVRGSVKVEWTGAAAEGVAYADTITLVPDALQMNLKDLPGAECPGLTSWPPTTAQCGAAKPGWGSQRLLNFTPATPVEVGSYRSPNSTVWPPPGEGIYGPRQARMFGKNLAFTTWMSDGLRVLDVSNPAAPTEVANYVPPAVADPSPGAGAGISNRSGALNRGPVWPDVTLVTGVDIIPIDQRSGYAVLSDINAGLRVVHFQIGGRHTDGLYHPVTPARILDTRPASETGGATPIGSCTPSPCAKLGASGNPNTIEVQVTGQGGIPSTGVTAVKMNVTATSPAGGAQFLKVYPSDAGEPNASNLNYTAGQTVPNLVTVKVGPTGKVKITNNAGEVHVLADVAGWYGNDTLASGARYNSLSPSRVLDTRTAAESGGATPIGSCTPSCSKLGAGTTPNTIEVQVTGRGAVPATGVSGVIMNVTATGTANGAQFLKVYPSDAAEPNASNLNYVDGQTVPNLVAVKVGPTGKVKITNNAGEVNVIADVAGWFGSDTNPVGGRFGPLTPARILDTRTAGETGGVAPIGSCTPSPCAKLGAGGNPNTIEVQVAGQGGVPANGVTSVTLNVTATGPAGGAAYLTVYPSDAGLPNVSNLNYVEGQTVPNLVTVKLGPTGKVKITNNAGEVNVLADVAGWYNSE